MKKTLRPEQELFAALLYFSEAKTCVEIGVFAGDTTVSLSRASARNDGKVFGFDVWARHGLAKQYKSHHTKEEVEKKLLQEGCKNVTLTQIDTRRQRAEFESLLDEMCPEIDFAFIDGCHSYVGVMNDFCAVYPRLTKAGIIAFHDTIIIDGCREFMLDLRTRFYDGTFDVVDFYAGRQKDTRIGISLLVKRALPVTDDPIIECCGSPCPPAVIEHREVDWYCRERAKKPSHELMAGANALPYKYTYYCGLLPLSKNRKKFDEEDMAQRGDQR